MLLALRKNLHAQLLKLPRSIISRDDDAHGALHGVPLLTARRRDAVIYDVDRQLVGLREVAADKLDLVRH